MRAGRREEHVTWREEHMTWREEHMTWREEHMTWREHRNYVGHFCITRGTEREEVTLLSRRTRYSRVLSSGGKDTFFYIARNVYYCQLLLNGLLKQDLMLITAYVTKTSCL